MKTTVGKNNETTEINGLYRHSAEKPYLALDALAKLTKQFASKPDFRSLMEVFILTLSGQFSVPSAFVILRNPELGCEDKVFIGTGKYRKEDDLISLKNSKDFCHFFNENRQPFRIENLLEQENIAPFARLLKDSGIKLIAPLSYEEELIGVIALGDKVNKTTFDEVEFDLFATLLLTIAPMIANSFLFMELSHMNSWYLEILDNVKMGVFIFDENHFLKKVNIIGLSILETFVPELTGTNSLSGLPIHEIFPDPVFHSWTHRFIDSDAKKHDELIENMVAKKDNRESIYNVRVSKVIYSNNSKYDLIITLDDITAQKENEQRLFELEKFADKGQMASSISHELNNFLALILGGVELTQIALGRGQLEKVETTLEKLKSHVDKMKRYTSGLMDYSRMNTSKELANINELVKDVLSFVAVQKKFKKVVIHTELDPEVPVFEMDKDQIAQLLLNFMNNAVDAINEAKNQMGQIWVKTNFENSLISISVADNGIGIKPEVKERLFKAHLTTKEKGHGYGLVTCARIIENHGGRIDIESEVGAGTLFTIYFPVNKGEDTVG